MKGLCKQAGIKPFGFHAIRRFVPSYLLSTGADIKEIQTILGHGNLSVTYSYIQRLKGSTKDTFGRLDGLFEEKAHTDGTHKEKGVAGYGG